MIILPRCTVCVPERAAKRLLLLSGGVCCMRAEMSYYQYISFLQSPCPARASLTCPTWLALCERRCGVHRPRERAGSGRS